MIARLKEKVDMSALQNRILGLLGTFIIRAINLISVPIFTRLLSTSEYGRVNIFMTYVGIFSILLGLDFNGAVAKGSLDFKDKKNEFFSVSLFFTSVFSLCVIAIINLFPDFFCAIFQMELYEVNILLVYSYASFVITYKSAEYIFQLRYKQNLMLGTVVGILNLIMSIFFIFIGFSHDKYLGRIIGAVVPTVVIAVLLYVKTLYRGKVLINKEYISYSSKMGIPLIPHNLSHMILTNADKIMINNMISSAASGIYGLVYNIGLMLSVLIEALNNVWNPWLFIKLENGEQNLVKKMTRFYLLGFTMITVAVMIVSPEVIKVIAPQEYWEGINVVNWIVYSVYLTFLYGLYVNIEFFYKKTYLISMGTLGAAICNITLNWLGLNYFGYEFAAVTTVISYAILVVAHMLLVSKMMKKSIIDDKYVFIFGILTFIFMCIIQLILNNFWLRVLCALAIELFLGAILIIWLKTSDKE